MKICLVRSIEHKSILGLFWAETNAELWWAVDEVADPSRYEYCALKNGALCFEGDNEPCIREWADGFADASDSDSEDMTEQDTWSGATELGALMDATTPAFSDTKKWRRFPFADEPGGGIDQAICIVSKRGKP